MSEQNKQDNQRFGSFREFYPFYLAEHSDVVCRRLHFVGSGLVLGVIAWVLATGAWVWLFSLPVIGYGFAWLGHFGFEKNRPATFKYPFYSLLGDWVMFAEILMGRISIIKPGPVVR